MAPINVFCPPNLKKTDYRPEKMTGSEKAANIN